MCTVPKPTSPISSESINCFSKKQETYDKGTKVLNYFHESRLSPKMWHRWDGCKTHSELMGPREKMESLWEPFTVENPFSPNQMSRSLSPYKNRIFAKLSWKWMGKCQSLSNNAKGQRMMHKTFSGFDIQFTILVEIL